MAAAGEDHRHSCSSAAAMTSGSRIDPPGCTTAAMPASAATSRPSRKGKNASEATTAPRRETLAFWMPIRGRVDATHLARPDPERPVGGGVDDRVRLHQAHHRPRELERVPLLLARRPPRDDLRLPHGVGGVVPVLGQDAPFTRLRSSRSETARRSPAFRGAAGSSSSRAPPGRRRRSPARAHPRRKLRDRGRGRAVDGNVEGDHAAEALVGSHSTALRNASAAERRGRRRTGCRA